MSFPENSIFGYDAGDHVPVRYFARERVPDATTADFNGMYGWPLAVGGFGVLFAFVNFGRYALMRR